MERLTDEQRAAVRAYNKHCNLLRFQKFAPVADSFKEAWELLSISQKNAWTKQKARSRQKVNKDLQNTWQNLTL